MSSKRHHSPECEKIIQVEYHWTRIVPVVLVVVGLTQFVFGISAAVRHFPKEFSFQRQFLSELGQTHIDGVLSNQTSCMIFTATIVFMGLCLIPMFLTIKDHFGEPDPAARILGVASAITLIGIGITPFNRVEALHLTALGLWLLSLGGLGILRVIRTMEVGGAAAWSGFISGGLVLAIAAYVLSFGDRRTAPFTQKIAILAAILWGLDLLRETSKYAYEVFTLRRTHFHAVEDYLAKLTSKPLIRGTPPDYTSRGSGCR